MHERDEEDDGEGIGFRPAAELCDEAKDLGLRDEMPVRMPRGGKDTPTNCRDLAELDEDAGAKDEYTERPESCLEQLAHARENRIAHLIAQLIGNLHWQDVGGKKEDERRHEQSRRAQQGVGLARPEAGTA